MKKILLALLLLVPQAALASTGTFTATQTVAPAAPVVVTIPDFVGGVDGTNEVLATGRFSLAGSISSLMTLQVGGAEILGAPVAHAFGAIDDFAAAAANQINLFSDYAANPSGSTVFLTAPSGTGATLNGAAITFTAGGDIQVTSIFNFTGGVDAIGAAFARATTSNFVSTASGVDLTLNIGGTAIALPSNQTASEAASSTAAQINAHAANSYSALAVGDKVELTAKVSGVGPNGPALASDLSYNGAVQTVIFAPGNVTANETFRATLDLIPYDHLVGAGDSLQNVVEALASLMDAHAGVSCTEDDVSITCVGDTTSTTFAFNAEVLEAAAAQPSAPVSRGSSRARSAPLGEVLGVMTSVNERAAQIAAAHAALQEIMINFITLLRQELANRP